MHNFYGDSDFGAGGRVVDGQDRVRGVRRRASEASAPKGVVALPSFDDVLSYSTPFVSEERREEHSAGLRRLFGISQ